MRTNDSNEIIEFNVGGKYYTSSMSTIRSYPDSMLSHLVNSSLPSATDSKSKIFIDRDGHLFRYILNFLRDKCLNLPDDFSEYAQLRQEADFYQIEPIITYMDNIYNKKLFKNNINSSMLSLNSINSSDNKSELPNVKGFYLTVVSKLYQGSLESLTGCIRILNTFANLDSNSKRFMNNLINPSNGSINISNTSLIPTINQLDKFVCECKFHLEEKIICIKPCGINGGDPNIASICQYVVRLAKKFGITVGYWEDMFYLALEFGVPNRELLCSSLTEKYNGKLLSTSVFDRRAYNDENSSCISLIERWYLPELKV